MMQKIRQMGVGKQKNTEKSPLEKGKYLKMRTNAHLFLLHGYLYDKNTKIQFNELSLLIFTFWDIAIQSCQVLG